MQPLPKSQTLLKTLEGFTPDAALTTVELPLASWNEIATHPRQRETQHHAKARHWNLAKEATGAPRENLRLVHAAWLNGEYYKVDGHTRTYLWAHGDLPEPESGTVICMIHKVASPEELNDLYNAFDASSAAMKSQDLGYGALRELGLVDALQSKRIRKGQIKGTLNLAIRGRMAPSQPAGLAALDIPKATAVLRDELVAVDSLNLRKDIFVSGVFAAALLTVADNRDALEFWRRLNDRISHRSPDGKRPDAAGKLIEQIELYRPGNRFRNPKVQDMLLGCAIRAYEGWDEGRRRGQDNYFANRFRYTNPFPYIERLRAARELDYEPDLFVPEEQVFLGGVPNSILDVDE